MGYTSFPALTERLHTMETALTVFGVVVFIAAIAYNIRRRRNLTPEQRMAEDTLNETRRLRREVKNLRRYGG